MLSSLAVFAVLLVSCNKAGSEAKQAVGDLIDALKIGEKIRDSAKIAEDVVRYYNTQAEAWKKYDSTMTKLEVKYPELKYNSWLMEYKQTKLMTIYTDDRILSNDLDKFKEDPAVKEAAERYRKAINNRWSQ
jgi:hypothetical protein